MENNIEKFCCDDLLYHATENKDISYDSQFNYYYLILRDNDCGTSCDLLYCPWCGTKLPQELSKKWGKILREEYGIKDPIFDDADKVPPEFHTDEWWKKRGL